MPRAGNERAGEIAERTLTEVAAGEALAARVNSLGDTPLVVVTGEDQRWKGMARPLTRALGRQSATM